MNIFSQSKLSLKIKTTNNTLSTTSINKPEINDSLKSEYISNNSMTESESFVEILHTVQSQDENVPVSQNVFKTSPVQHEPNIIKESKQCPVCLLMVDVKNVINHIKSCGSSHKLSSEVLIKAVDLQERQTAEREALGLPKITKNKDVKKKIKRNIKQKKLKIGNDCNLDLALAMSVSLQESKEAEIIKESETLLEAGLEKEALEKRKTLESFGFISNQTVKFKSKVIKANSLLFNQTKENREKRITEKVAKILIDTDTDALWSEILENHYFKTQLGSKYLNKIRNVDNILWKKALLEETNLCEFYVKNLSKYIRPNTSNNFTGLKNVLFSTDQDTSNLELNTSNNEINQIDMAIDNLDVDNISIASHKIVENNIRSDYSSKWESMIGNQYMSDVTIFSKDVHEIPAHTLVFYVQCPNILDDIIVEESVTCKSKKMIMWLEYSYEACLAFLKVIYSGQESFIKSEYREDYLNLVTKYNILLDVNNDNKHGWESKKNDKISKRKNPEFFNSLIGSKRYKASSPDMFISDDVTLNACLSSNFLETTLNDETSLSTLKTKQWLYSCKNISQEQTNLSSMENLVINISPKSPSHSFHSASTVSLQLSPISNTIDYNKNSENNDLHLCSFNNNISSPKLSINESKMKTNQMWHEMKNDSNTTSTPSTKMSILTNVRKKPELIVINSDSDNESLDIIECNSVKTSCNSNQVLCINLLNENNETPLSQSNNKDEKYINTIELNDASLDSFYLDNTNVVNQRHNTISHSTLSHSSSKLNSRKKTFTNINNKSSMENINAVTNNFKIQIPSNNNVEVIDLLVESSSDSVSTIDLTKLSKNNLEISNSKSSSIINTQYGCQNVLPSFSNINSSERNLSFNQTNFGIKNKTNNFSSGSSKNIDIKTNEDFDLNLINSSNKVDSKLFECNNKPLLFLNSINYTKMNNVENNVNISNSNEIDVLGKCNSDSELLKNNPITKTNIVLTTNSSKDSLINSKEVVNLASSTSKFINKCTSISSVNTQIEEPTQQSQIINTSITDLIEKDFDQDKSDFEQIIDDPWMDYNDWQPVNISPQYISSLVLSDSNSIVNESEEQNLLSKNVPNINLDLQTPTNNSNKINFQKKSAVTPNKYGSKMNTPKSLRRVQSESIIGSNEQVTPLPDYSSMKTPDLRKEFDRYGLKDLGKRKGKLILRHIYDVLHPLHTSEDAVCNTEIEQFSDSSNSSEHGIPDYEGGSYDELETCSQTNSSNKISVEMGFKQLLAVKEDLHKQILCYEPIWIEELKEYLKQYNVSISMQKLMTFLDDKCVTFRSRSLTVQRQKTSKKNIKRKKLF